MVQVASLETGKSFGEKALINDAPRAASIQAVTDCHFAVLKKDGYLKVLKKLETRLYNSKMDYFSNLPCLQG
jgi:CRP-like cAMP-binding protein